MIDSVRQRVSALYRWRLSRLRNLVVGRYRVHFANLRGLTPVPVQNVQVRSKKKFNSESTLHALYMYKSRVNHLSRDRVL